MLFFYLLQYISCAEQCTPYKTLVDITYDDDKYRYIGKSQPVYLRMYFAGCIYSPSSQKFWDEAALLYPHMTFLTVDCINNNNLAFCRANSKTLDTPSHVLFAANSTKPITDSFFNRPTPITESSTYFQETIAYYLNISSIAPPIVTLTNMSTVSFYEEYQYKIFINYNSACVEDNNWVGKWANVINRTFYPEDDQQYKLGFGLLDCSKFPFECLRWGSSETSAILYSPKGSRVKIASTITNEEELTKTIQDRIITLDGMTTKVEMPLPVTTPTPVPPPAPTPAFNLIRNDALEQRDLELMKNDYYTNIKSNLNGAKATSGGILGSCTSIPTHNDIDKEDAKRALNYVRKLAGLKPIVNNVSWNDGCMKLCLTLHKIGWLTHTPPNSSQYCSADKDWPSYQVGQLSNLASGEETAFEAVFGLIEDTGANNQNSVGHRRSLLHPHLKEYGIGHYPFEREVLTGYNMLYPPVTAIQWVPFVGYIPRDPEYDVKFVSWPSAGPFPLDKTPAIWHVSYTGFSGLKTDASDLLIKVTRDDGLNLPIQRKLLSDSQWPTACLFELSDLALSYCVAGHSYHVQIFMLNGSNNCIDYNIQFFDEKSNVYSCFYDSDKTKCPSTIPDSRKYGRGYYNSIQRSANYLNEHHYITVAEPIKLGSNAIKMNFAPKITFYDKTIEGTIIIDKDTSIDIADGSLTDFIFAIENANVTLQSSGNTFLAPFGGKLSSSKTPKSITVDVINAPNSPNYKEIEIYSGPATFIKLKQTKYSSGDEDYLFGIKPKETKTLFTYFHISQFQEFSIGSCTLGITTVKDLLNIPYSSFNKKTLRIHQCGYGSTSNYISSKILHPTKKLNYEIIMEQSLDIYINYTLDMDTRINKLSIIPKNQNFFPKTIYLDYAGTPNDLMLRGKVGFPFYVENILYTGSKTQVSPPNLVFDKLLGDSKAFALLQNPEYNIIYSDILNGTNGVITANGKPSSGTPTYFPIIRTSGQNKFITFHNMDNPRGYQFEPEIGAEHIPIRINLTTDISKNYYPRSAKSLFFVNYQNITIEFNTTYMSSLRFINVSSYTIVNGPTNYTNPVEIITTSPVTSLLNEKPTTYDEIKLSSSTELDTKNVEAKKVTVGFIETTIKNMKITAEMSLTNSKVTLDNVNLGSEVVIGLKRTTEWPSISIRGGTFNPKQINFDLAKISSSKLLAATNEETNILITGISGSDCQSLLTKTMLLSNPSNTYKAVCGPSKTTIYVTNSNSEIVEDAGVVQPDYPGIDPNVPVITTAPVVTTTTKTAPGVTTTAETSDGNDGEPSKETTSTGNSGGNEDDSGERKKKNGISGGAIAGIIIGVLAAVAIVIVVLYIYVIKPRTNKANNSSGNKHEDKEETHMDNDEEI